MNDRKKPEAGSGLALSGGGYRAMLFHLGTFWRLQELGILGTLDRISSVSGGSITSAKLALEWPRISSLSDLIEHVVEPVRSLASKTIDRGSIIRGIILPGSATDRVSTRYEKELFGSATLQDLPDTPRFVINATNVETGLLWRFSKPYMGDYSVGRVSKPVVRLADAVAASSAFPPVLSPFILDIEPDAFDLPARDTPGTFRSGIMLTDGGVYDNLGLETIEKRYQTVLVSDAGAAIARDPTPSSDWARHAHRVLDIIHAQVSSLRRRNLVDVYKKGERSGAYWGIGSDISNYQLPDSLAAPYARTRQLAETPTRLKGLGDDLQERIINWGYAVCDAAVRAHWRSDLPPPAALPYPDRGI